MYKLSLSLLVSFVLCAFFVGGSCEAGAQSENYLFSFFTISSCSEKDNSDDVTYSFFLYEWFEDLFE